ncbi:hypothetical protein OBBRIDRAFT_516191 [Obba rivulosa]|uniref:Uncharacterized protein n=1 Tax=Obba rivulosa TaxID=1052685 RepID=A0A8E2DLJ2_9APHY|nr:hypothetical protein OBBRIDRAFT_516191 [Obba rivulosa]
MCVKSGQLYTCDRIPENLWDSNFTRGFKLSSRRHRTSRAGSESALHTSAAAARVFLPWPCPHSQSSSNISHQTSYGIDDDCMGANGRRQTGLGWRTLSIRACTGSRLSEDPALRIVTSVAFGVPPDSTKALSILCWFSFELPSRRSTCRYRKVAKGCQNSNIDNLACRDEELMG